MCRSQCDSLQGHVSSLDLHCSSLTSDLFRVRGLLSGSRREAAGFSLAGALLAGALRHSLCRVRALSQQKRLLARQLAGRELLEEEVARLADALGGDAEERGRRAARRWRRSVWAVVAVRRWRRLDSTVLFRLEGGGVAVSVSTKGKSSQSSSRWR